MDKTKVRNIGPRDEECVNPTLDRVLRDLRFYAEILAKSKPTRYEVYQTAEGGTVRLSDCIRVLLEERDMVIVRSIMAVPDNWVDSLLTGPEGIGQPPYNCPDIEKLCKAIRERIRTRMLLASAEQTVSTPTQRAPEVTDEDVALAKVTYSATFLARRPEQRGHAMSLADHNAANDAAFKAVLEQFVAKGSTTPKSTPTGQRLHSNSQGDGQ